MTRIAARSWEVIEAFADTGERWDATWKLHADGRSFDAHWTHIPGGDKGVNRNFARILTLEASKIIIERPGMGRYEGTITPDRLHISGGNTWSRASWTVNLSQPLPESL